jgi:hypothetical protein
MMKIFTNWITRKFGNSCNGRQSDDLKSGSPRRGPAYELEKAALASYIGTIDAAPYC